MAQVAFKKILIVLALCVASLSANSQIIINEILCSNGSDHLIPETGRFADWIELYNTDPEAKDLAGYFLSDSDNNPAKWTIPPNTTIPGNGYLVFYADKEDYYLHTNFGLSRDGERILLHNPEGLLLDRIEFGRQKPDVSYGRDLQNPIDLVFFAEPTPGFENSTVGISRPILTQTPNLSPDAGFYDGEVSASLIGSVSETAIVHYTTDGSTPTPSSEIFSADVQIIQTTTLKIRSFKDGFLPSEVVAKTYFISEQTNLPVFSISLRPDYLWNDDYGIYIDGSSFNGDRTSRNSCQTDWERPMHIEFFESDGELIFSESAGLQVKGRMNCEFPKKPLGVYFRSKYGEGQVNYPFFKDKTVSQFKSFILRPGGADGMGDCYNGTMFRDGLLGNLLIGQMDIDVEGFRPAILFINGEYWGIHNIRERNKKDYLATNHDVDSDNLDILENPANGGIVEGDDEHYNQLINLVASDAIITDEGLVAVKKMIDLQEFINYQIAEIFVNNEDWAHNNVLCWRPRTADGIWRWIFFDVEGGFGLYHDDDYTNNLFFFKGDGFLRHSYLFSRLMKNPTIKNDFIQAFAAHLNTTFHPDRVIIMMHEMQSEIQEEMQKDVIRWNGHKTNGGSGCSPISSMDQWLSHIGIMENFARQRPDIIRQQLQDLYHLEDMAELTLESEGGSITINGVDQAGSGSYFTGLPLNLEAVPDIGYQFVAWTGFGSNPLLTINLNEDTQVTAIFEHSEESILPPIISDQRVLDLSGSPYLASSDIIIEKGGILRINAGVEIQMPEGASIYVHGVLQAVGEKESPVKITSLHGNNKRWGALVFSEGESGSSIGHLLIEQASIGAQNAALFKANLTIYKTFVPLNGLIINDADHNPVFVKNARAEITNSELFSYGVGDYINISGREDVRIENCLFKGNSASDTDAVDLDGVGNAQINDCRFENFLGPNSDGLDVGYSYNVELNRNVFSNISDKGVSIGMGSIVRAFGNVFLNCHDGIGIKDKGSIVIADRNTFFGNNNGVHSFEKEPGRGGGTAEIENSLFTGFEQEAGLFDSYSTIDFSYCWNQNDLLSGFANHSGDPKLIDPSYGIFRLKATSLCRESGNPESENDPDGTRADIGAYYYHQEKIEGIYLNEVILGASTIKVEILNLGQVSVDLDALSLSINKNSSEALSVKTYIDGSSNLSPGDRILVSTPVIDFPTWQAGDLLMLSQSINGEQILLNSLPLSQFLKDYSIGYFPEGSYQIRHFTEPTPGYENYIEASGSGQIFINELLADNQSTISDEYDEYDDWLELYNAGSDDFDLGGLYLTDNLRNPTKQQLPHSKESGMLLPSRQFKFFWADEDENSGSQHLNFRLDAEDEEIGLFRVMFPDTLLIDSLKFANQLPDRSIGRHPDGASTIQEFTMVTPGESNIIMNIIDSDNSFTMKLFPNPCEEFLYMETRGLIAENTFLEIIDLTGKSMLRVDVARNTFGVVSIPVQQLPPGMYIAKLVGSNTFRTARILKQ